MTREDAALVVQVFEDFVKRLVIEGMTGEANDYFNLENARRNLITVLEKLEVKPNEEGS